MQGYLMRWYFVPPELVAEFRLLQEAMARGEEGSDFSQEFAPFERFRLEQPLSSYIFFLAEP